MRYIAIDINLSQRIFTEILILHPILNIYHSGINVKIGIGDALMLVFLVLYVPDVLKRKLVITDYFFFMIYIIAISFVDIAVVNGDGIRIVNLLRIVRHGFYGVIICVYMPHYFNLNYGTSLIKKISCIVSIGIVLQSVLFYIFHKLQFFWLPVRAFTGGELKAVRLSAMRSLALGGYFRPSFIFIEPAHFAQYVIMALLLFLFCEKRRSRAIAGASLCTFGIILSTSAGGILIMTVGWAVWLLKVLKKIITERKIERYICWYLLFLTIAVGSMLLFTGVGKMMVRRISEIDTGMSYTSGNLRVLRGFQIFHKLNSWRQLFGLGLGNIDDYFTQLRITMPYEDMGEYMNSLTYILNSAGIGGALLLLGVLLRRIYRKDIFCTALSLVTLALIFGSSIFNSGPWLIYMAFLLYKKNIVNIVRTENGQC